MGLPEQIPPATDITTQHSWRSALICWPLLFLSLDDRENEDKRQDRENEDKRQDRENEDKRQDRENEDKRQDRENEDKPIKSLLSAVLGSSIPLKAH
uniref:Uncharacterized protein n=1 Tax=Salmo trutta TaxID=8032 RepID=A0A673W8A5_SALTR